MCRSVTYPITRAEVFHLEAVEVEVKREHCVTLVDRLRLKEKGGEITAISSVAKNRH